MDAKDHAALRIDTLTAECMQDMREGYALAKRQKLICLEMLTGVPFFQVEQMLKSTIEMQACGPIYFHANGGET